MRPQKKTSRKKPRTPVKEPHIAKRLELLQEPGESGRAFARRLGVDFRLLRLWLRGERAPNVGSLRTIAEKTGVSLDWLLDGIGYDGAPHADPIVRGQWSTKPELEAEIAVTVSRAIRDKVEHEARRTEFASAFTVDGAAVLNAALGLVVAEVTTWCNWLTDEYIPLFTTVSKLRGELDDSVQALRKLVAAGADFATVEHDADAVARLHATTATLAAQLAPQFRSSEYTSIREHGYLGEFCERAHQAMTATATPGRVSKMTGAPGNGGKSAIRINLDGELLAIDGEWIPNPPYYETITRIGLSAISRRVLG